MKLYNRNWTRRDLEARAGRMDAIGGIRRFREEHGPETGVEWIQVRTGGGLTYYANASRALDISLLEYCGAPLSWHAVNGEINPNYFDPEGMEWLRTAAGGFLMTCGLLTAGAPSEDGGEKFGIHGRIHHLPARVLNAEAAWEGDEYSMRIKGVADETRIFGENLRLTRQIESRLGENRIILNDRVENLGFKPVPHMFLYHFNFGFPLMDDNTEIIIPSRKVVRREEDYPLEGWDRWDAPEADYQERVYYHEMDPAEIRDGMARAEIVNPNFPAGGHAAVRLTVRLEWDVETLPRLTEWKMPEAGTHALGIEPANCLVEGRAAERKRGTLVTLEPGESKNYHVELTIESE